MSNHYSAFQDLSNLPLHSLHILSYGMKVHKTVLSDSLGLISFSLYNCFRDSPSLMSSGRMPLTAVL